MKTLPRKSTWISRTSKCTLAFYLASALFTPTPSLAEVSSNNFAAGNTMGGSGGSGLPTTDISATDDACAPICEPFLWSQNATSKNGKPGLGGTSTWNTTDDVLCQNMGSPTGPGYITQLPPPDAAFSSANPGCSVNISSDVLAKIRGMDPSADASTYCGTAGKLKDHCKYHNSQLEPQCLAYNSFDDAHTSPKLANEIMIGIDGAVVALCGIACYFAAAPAPVHTACGIAAAAAGAAEFAVTMSMKQDNDIAKYVGMFGGLGGAGVGVAGIVSGVQDTKAAAAAKTNAPAPTQGKAAEPAEAERNKLTCFTAILFAAMMGVRIYNEIQMGKAKEEACQKIQKLSSTITSAATAKTASGSGSGFTPGAPVGGATTVTRGGGSTTAGDKLASYTNCMNGTGGGACDATCQSTCMSTAGINPQTMSATDGDAVRTSGITPMAMNQMPNPKDFLKKATTEGAGAAVAASLPPEMGAAGQALAAIADIGQKNPELFAGQFSVPAAYASGGGGGGGGGGSKAENPFGNLFGGGAAGGGPAAAAGVMQFGTSEGPDIWHSKSTDNLFQIVSDKIGRVTTRVQ